MIHIVSKVMLNNLEIVSKGYSIQPQQLSSPATILQAKAQVEETLTTACNKVFQPPIEQLIKDETKGQFYEELGKQIREIAVQVENGHYPNVQVQSTTFGDKTLTIYLSE
jgi:hypothetical protein